jgi:hypothetical protein
MVAYACAYPSPWLCLLSPRCQVQRFRCWVCVRACACAYANVTIRVWVYGDVSCMCTFKLNNFGKVTIIYIVYILGEMVNLVKHKLVK